MQPPLTRLYSLLRVPTLTTAQFLAHVALPHWAALPDRVQAVALTRIQSDWATLKSDPGLVSALKATAFVLAEEPAPNQATSSPETTASSSNSSSPVVLKRPTELYDPGHPLYSKVYRGAGRFPAGQYAYPSWLEVLRDCGLVHAVTTDSFLAAARQVEARGAAVFGSSMGFGGTASSTDGVAGTPALSPETASGGCAALGPVTYVCDLLGKSCGCAPSCTLIFISLTAPSCSTPLCYSHVLGRVLSPAVFCLSFVW